MINDMFFGLGGIHSLPMEVSDKPTLAFFRFRTGPTTGMVLSILSSEPGSNEISC